MIAARIYPPWMGGDIRELPYIYEPGPETIMDNTIKT